MKSVNQNKLYSLISRPGYLFLLPQTLPSGNLQMSWNKKSDLQKVFCRQ